MFRNSRCKDGTIGLLTFTTEIYEDMKLGGSITLGRIHVYKVRSLSFLTINSMILIS